MVGVLVKKRMMTETDWDVAYHKKDVTPHDTNKFKLSLTHNIVFKPKAHGLCVVGRTNSGTSFYRQAEIKRSCFLNQAA